MNTNNDYFASHNWSTADEIEYLEGLSTHATLGRSGLTRLELLLQYQRVLNYRPLSERYLDFGRLRSRVKRLIEMERVLG